MVKLNFAELVRQQYYNSKKMDEYNRPDYSFVSPILTIKRFNLSDTDSRGMRRADMGEFDLFRLPKNEHFANVYFIGAIPVTEYWNTLSALKNMRTAAALGIWQAHPWMGVGADGFRHFAGLAIAGKDWGLMKADPACVYNDCLQFLCEFGVLGSGVLLAAVLALMIPICYRARIAWGYNAHDGNEGRHFLMRISPIVLTGVLATFVCFLESWIANPFRFPSLLLSWVCVMAVLPAFLPTRAMPAAPQI